jgi:transposase
MKEQLPKQVNTDEFRAQAVLLVTRDGLSIAEAARRLSMSLKTLANWVKRAKGGQLTAVRDGTRVVQRVITGEQAEVSRLRREVAELRMERNILKKATAYFATESLLWSSGDQELTQRLPARGALPRARCFHERLPRMACAAAIAARRVPERASRWQHRQRIKERAPLTALSDYRRS